MAHHGSTIYQHLPLDRRDSIRLLELLPGEFGQPLQCHIHIVPSNNNVSFEALSYTWDEPKFPHQIHVGTDLASPIIQLTLNLYNALQHLRDTSAPRTLWIDALCINQSDEEEKGHQVAHMGQIYSGAENVVLWLGLSRNKRVVDILEAAERGQDGSQDRNNRDIWRTQTEPTRIMARLNAASFFKISWYENRFHQAIFLPHSEALTTLNRFFRVWTVQEFVLGKRVNLQIPRWPLSYTSFSGTLARLWTTMTGTQARACVISIS